MSSVIDRYYAKYGPASRLNPHAMRESAAFLAGLATPQMGQAPTPHQLRFSRAAVRLVRAARLIEMAVQD